MRLRYIIHIIRRNGGKYPGAGLDLLKKVGDKVSQGESLYRIHSTNSTDFAFANSVIDGGNGYEVS